VVAPGSGASGTFAGGITTAVTDGTGTATSAVFTANVTAGSYVVTASIGALTTSFTMTNNAGNAASMAVAGGSPQSAGINTAFANRLKALVKDANNNPVSGVTVTFTAPGSGATVAFAGGLTTAVTDGTGVATSAAITASSVLGSYTVVASANPGLSANFSLTNAGGPPSSVTVVSGAGQGAVINTAFVSPLQVRVIDSVGNPVSGVTVTFTPPASGAGGSFAGGQNTALTDSLGMARSAIFTANGSAGTYNVAATVSGINPANFSLTNLSSGGSFITVAHATVGKNLQAPISITLTPSAPPSGVTLSIQSGNASLVLLGSGSAVGVQSLSPTLAAGSITVSTFVQALASSGTAAITVNAPGYVSAVATITLAPSGFVVAGPNGAGAPFTTYQGATTSLTVSAGRLDASGILVESQQIRGGFSTSVPVMSSVTTVGNVSLSSVAMNGGNQSALVDFVASGANSGTTNVSVSAPLGFSTPTTGTTVNVVVQQSGLIPFTTTVGQNLEKVANISLTGVATSGVPVTLLSSDPSKLQFSLSAAGPASSSIVVTIPPGHDHSPDFYVQALSNVGTAGYTATASGFGTVNGTVTLASSGLSIQSPGGAGAASFQAPIGFGAAGLIISTGRLDSSGVFVESQLVASSGSVSITVLSSNTSVGTIGSSPITIAGGLGSATTSLQPVTSGPTTVTASAAQFASAQVAATFTNQNLIVDSAITVGKNLQQPVNLILPQAAGPAGVQVTVQSNSPNVKLAAASTDAGTDTITITVPATVSTVQFYVQALTDTGSGTYTASTAGIGSASGTATFAKSGIVIQPSSMSKSLSLGTTTATVYTALLNASNVPQSPQSLAGGLPLDVAVASNHTNIATVPSTVTIQPGTNNSTLTITLAATGSANIMLTQPAGFTTPSSLTSMLLTVTP
jgi:hypothetical protein